MIDQSKHESNYKKQAKKKRRNQEDKTFSTNTIDVNESINRLESLTITHQQITSVSGTWHSLVHILHIESFVTGQSLTEIHASVAIQSSSFVSSQQIL